MIRNWYPLALIAVTFGCSSGHQEQHVRPQPHFVFPAPLIPEATGTVAVADLNGDRVPDVVGGGAVALGNGDGTFQRKATPVAVGAGVVLGDFTADGKVDMVVPSGYGVSFSEVKVFSGKGDGTFPDVAATYQLPKQAVSIASADFNGDGQPDLVTSNTDNTLTFLMTSKGGALQVTNSPPVDLIASSWNGVRTGDFNGDGKPDLVFAPVQVNGSSHLQAVLIFGRGGGAFENPVAREIDNALYLIADANGDGRSDLIGIDSTDSAFTLLTGADGSFTKTPPVAIGFVASGLRASADLNGDGKPDLIATEADSNRIAVLLNDGNGGLRPGVAVPSIEKPVGLLPADFDGDGKVDLVVSSASSAVLLLGSGDGSFQAPLASALGAKNPLWFFADSADFNRDGQTDLLLCDQEDAIPFVSYGRGDGTFDTSSSQAFIVQLDGCKVADVNGDQRPDVIYASDFDGSPHTPGSHLLGTLFLSSSGPQRVESDAGSSSPLKGALDVDGDGKVDAVLPRGWRPGNGDGTFGASSALPVPIEVVQVADLNSDGVSDLLGLSSSGTFAYAFGKGDGGVSSLVTNSSWPSGDAFLLADFNGDHRSDIAVLSQGMLVGYLWRMADDTFEFQAMSPPLAVGKGTAPGDFNGDGKEDLVSWSEAELALYLGLGDGGFSAPGKYLGAGEQEIGVVGDFNHDGISDVAVTSSGAGQPLRVSLGRKR